MEIGKQKKKQALFVVFITLLLVCVITIMDYFHMPKRNEKGQFIIERGSYGAGKENVQLRAEVGKHHHNMSLEVEGQQYSEKEIPKIIEEATRKLEKIVLGKNKSFDEVRKDLNLVTEIPNTGVQVTWEMDRYDLIDLSGKIMHDQIPKTGEVIQLKAILAAGQTEMEHIFYVHLFPPKLNKEDAQKKKIEDQAKAMEAKDKTSPYVVLPEYVDGKKLTWRYPQDSRAAGVLLLGSFLAGFLVFWEEYEKKKKETFRKEELLREYPQIVSQLTLFVKAGMPVRTAWFKIAETYEKEKKVPQSAYEEMVYTMNEIKHGISESESYERFGQRCGLISYRRFGTLLSGNIKKGTKGMTELLKKETMEAFEERKNRAKKLGEEAGTKLLGPMFMMLLVVLTIIVVPAFLSIQI